MVQVLSSLSQFNQVTGAGGIVVVDFFATWCGPCRVIAPTFEKLAGQYKQAQFFKCDVDQSPDISQSQGVRAMPTFCIYKGGKKVETIMGADPRKLENAIRQHAGEPAKDTSASHNWGPGRTLGSSTEPSRDVPAAPMEAVRSAATDAAAKFNQVDGGMKVILGLLALYLIYIVFFSA